MRGFIVRLLICSLGLWIASAIVPGMNIVGVGTLLLASLLLGFVNAVVRPILIVLTLPFTIISLGLFLLVINATMLGLVAALLEGFSLSGFMSALLGSIVVSITSWLSSWYIGPKGRVDVMVVRGRSH